MTAIVTARSSEIAAMPRTSAPSCWQRHSDVLEEQDPMRPTAGIARRRAVAKASPVSASSVAKTSSRR